MDPETRLAKELLAVLQDIKKEQMTITSGSPLIYSYRRDEDAVKLGLPKNPNEQEKLIKKLIELGAFSMAELPLSKDFQMFTKEDAPLLVRSYKLDINQERFEELYEAYVLKSYSRKSSENNQVAVKDLEVRLVKEGANLRIETPNESVFLSRLKTGLIPERLFAALIVNYGNGRFVTRAELRKEIDGLTGLSNISETIRLAGFRGDLKHIFFPHCTQNEVELKNPAVVTQNEIDMILSLNRA